MDFSVTERGTFKRCRRKTTLTSKNGKHLTKLFGPLSLSTGTIVHRAHQLWLNNPGSDLQKQTLTAANEAIDQATARYKERVGTDPSDEELGSTYESIDFCVSMALNYNERYQHQSLPARYQLIKSEQKVAVEVPGTEHKCVPCNGRGETYHTIQATSLIERCLVCNGTGTALHRLTGKLDALVRDLETGDVGILERKTYNQRPKEEVLKRVDQFKAYAWLVKQLNLNKGPVFLLYDGLWRRHVPPKGRDFSDLFARYRLSWSEQVMQQFDKYLPAELNDMAEVYADDSKAYPHVPWMGCNDCGVMSICHLMDEGLSTAYEISSKYTERTDDLDDDL